MVDLASVIPLDLTSKIISTCKRLEFFFFGSVTEKIIKYFLFSISYGIIKIATFLLRFSMQILDSSKLKEVADDNFKFDENGRKFSKWVESTVGKGEIARYEQFLLFPQRFQMTCTAD